MSNQYKVNMSFEASVRRTAEAVWGLAPGAIQPTFYPDDPVVRELDGIARLRDVTHLLMVTTSTKLDKITGDVKKLNAAESIERRNASAVSKWVITEKQIEAQHVEIARKSNVVVLTHESFRRRFFDSGKYLSLRARYSFGSARDPVTDSITIADDAYVPLPMRSRQVSSSASVMPASTQISVEEIVKKISNGGFAVLLAPFGAGKSLTTREVFRRLAEAHDKDPLLPVPLCLNLREHWGADYADELLERHARAVGYSPKEDLVVAWRAGMCCLLLDGFDELAAQTLVRLENKNFMRDARRRALNGLRDLTQKAPAGIGLLLCGRDHYFDNEQELVSSLGVDVNSTIAVTIDEFSEESARAFLHKNKINDELPDWLPRKPLILSYLLRENLFQEITQIDSERGFGFAWDSFLEKICYRESILENSSMEARSIRGVMERLAELVRTRASGTGPITGNDLAEAYHAETGQTAGEGVLAQLQRLPGLTQRDNEPGDRSFVDADMLAALQGSAFARRALSSFEKTDNTPLSELSEKAIAMSVYSLGKSDARSDTIIGVAGQLVRRNHRERVPLQFIGDCVSIALRMAVAEGRSKFDFRGIVVDDAILGEISLDEISISGLEIRNCIVKQLTLGGDLNDVTFVNCIIQRICGASSLAGVPGGIIDDLSIIEEFDDITTNRAVLNSDMAAPVKALITILRKLYKQAGSGRKRAALTRGITRADVQVYIEPVLAVLVSQGFVSIFNNVVHPVRKQSSRVEMILVAPLVCGDDLVSRVLALESNR